MLVGIEHDRIVTAGKLTEHLCTAKVSALLFGSHLQLKRGEPLIER